MVMVCLELRGDQYFNGLTNDLSILVAKHTLCCRVYQYDIAVMARKDDTFSGILK